MTPLEVLQKARKGLPGHWVQNTYYDDEKGTGCLLGHILMARHDGKHKIFWTTSTTEAEKIVQGIITEQYPELAVQAFRQGESLVPYFNDAEDRTEDEVVAVLEKAIIKAEEDAS